MEMMRAVLDSNFWLATHVVTITIGYSTTFLAGFLGIAYVFSMLFRTVVKSSSKGKDLDRTLVSMIFGITCFSLFFSLVGTVLGGIWADQSWGRFWGWDAKENGALLIVIWNAIILHARWAGIAKIRGLSALAILGNVVTAWSWFGTNMLGVGLHSYGFMDKAFVPLMAFIGSQVAIIVLAYLPALLSIFTRKPEGHLIIQALVPFGLPFKSHTLCFLTGNTPVFLPKSVKFITFCEVIKMLLTSNCLILMSSKNDFPQVNILPGMKNRRRLLLTDH